MLIDQLISKEMREQISREERVYERLILKTMHIRHKYLKRPAGKEVCGSMSYENGEPGGE